MTNIKRLRQQAALSQCELAAQLDVTQSTISQWETGAVYPRAELLPKIAALLSCEIADILNAITEASKQKSTRSPTDK